MKRLPPLAHVTVRCPLPGRRVYTPRRGQRMRKIRDVLRLPRSATARTKTKGCLNRKTALAMVFSLMMSAKKKWRKISGPNRLPEVIQGIAFKYGIKQLQNAA